MFLNAIQGAVVTSKSGVAQDSVKRLSFLASFHPHNLGSKGVPVEAIYQEVWWQIFKVGASLF